MRYVLAFGFTTIFLYLLIDDIAAITYWRVYYLKVIYAILLVIYFSIRFATNHRSADSADC